MDTRSPAFVLSLYDTGLSVVRLLGRAGVNVTGFDFDRRQLGFHSRYCTALVCPDPVSRPDELVELLLAEAARFDTPPILFPASDAFFLFMSRYREALSTRFQFLLPPKDVAEAGANKRLQYDLATRAGLALPPTYYPESLEDVERIKGEVEYPAVVKPYYSHLWAARFPKSKAELVDGPQQLSRLCAELLPLDLQIMVQSYVSGPTTNIQVASFYIGQGGEPLGIVTHFKIRQFDPILGTGTLVESKRLPEAVRLGLQFLRSMDYRGQCSIEFKLDPKDDRLKLMELNPRFVQQVMLLARCGVNLPVLQYMDLTGQSPKPQTATEEGIRWVDALVDTMAFVYYRKLEGLSRLGWLHSISHSRAFPKFAWDDPLPFLREYMRAIPKIPPWMWKHRNI